MRDYRFTAQFIISTVMVFAFGSIALCVHGVGPDVDLAGYVADEIIVKFNEGVGGESVITGFCQFYFLL